ncbi:protein kinase family protein [Aspergillus vadensis CBS 113365]|uniref:Kinase domain-containing protein n=1 Tax=Aspergillus vadensis (strain CBS 113365 / IMI 142717 / IBT 24658) TaxID=1448311 RepID=A0A319BIK8_ASPVC|nr:kinase domain-containing protein [Aspergillus vadensis CBS 113365]PYH72131.1 kinase domain-containing protein [Aspergillus vadensis CBS 113365]
MMAQPASKTARIGDLYDDTTDFGDFVSTSDEEIDVEEYAEPWGKYDPETQYAYYPISLGEILNERYLIEHKLGAGGFSTVWMAFDLQETKDVAVKVFRKGDFGDIELRIQDEIVRSVQDRSHLVTYTDTFILKGSDGHHGVIVLPLMGPCLDRYTVTNLAINTRMSAAKQLLKALEALHNAGIVHRDLSERNCLWGMAPLHNLSRTAKYELLTRPLKETIQDVGLWKPGELMRPIQVPEALHTEDFYLADFSLAMKVGDPVAQPGDPPLCFCSPERLHGEPPSFACDMWSYMVNFVELYQGGRPFHDGYIGGVLTTITARLGPLPEQRKGSYIYDDCLPGFLVRPESNARYE